MPLNLLTIKNESIYMSFTLFTVKLLLSLFLHHTDLLIWFLLCSCWLFTSDYTGFTKYANTNSLKFNTLIILFYSIYNIYKFFVQCP